MVRLEVLDHSVERVVGHVAKLLEVEHHGACLERCFQSVQNIRGLCYLIDILLVFEKDAKFTAYIAVEFFRAQNRLALSLRRDSLRDWL